MGEYPVTGGSLAMTRWVAVTALLCAALALSACGRKGALDAPPAALNDPNVGTEAQPQAEEQSSVLRPGGANALPVIRGPKKRIPLDALLD